MAMGSRAQRVGLVGSIVLLGAVCGGCEDLGRFRTGSNQVFAGQVLGTKTAEECRGERPCSFIRRSFPAGTRMRLRFDPSEATSDPGSITTLDGDALCGERTFDETPLMPIAPLVHDHLSLYGFPGGDRLRNYIFIARPDQGGLEGRDATVFVSLLQGGKVEVRILAGPGNDCAPDECAAFDAGRCDFFGIFPLKKEKLE